MLDVITVQTHIKDKNDKYHPKKVHKAHLVGKLAL